jgi:hypothetical protein
MQTRAVRLSDAAEDGVGQVARVIAHGARARVRREDRRARGLDRVERGAVGDVADVHHHAELVHARDERATRVGEPAPRMRAGRGVAEDVVVRPRDRDVADTALRELAEAIEQDRRLALAEAVRALDAHEERDAVITRGGAHLGGRRREHHLVRVRGDERAHGGHERLRPIPRRLAAKASRIDPDAHEDRGQPAVPHARQIEVTVGQAAREIRVLVEQALRGVRVRVDRDEHVVGRRRGRLVRRSVLRVPRVGWLGRRACDRYGLGLVRGRSFGRLRGLARRAFVDARRFAWARALGGRRLERARARRRSTGAREEREREPERPSRRDHRPPSMTRKRARRSFAASSEALPGATLGEGCGSLRAPIGGVLGVLPGGAPTRPADDSPDSDTSASAALEATDARCSASGTIDREPSALWRAPGRAEGAAPGGARRASRIHGAATHSRARRPVMRSGPKAPPTGAASWPCPPTPRRDRARAAAGAPRPRCRARWSGRSPRRSRASRSGSATPCPGTRDRRTRPRRRTRARAGSSDRGRSRDAPASSDARSPAARRPCDARRSAGAACGLRRRRPRWPPGWGDECPYASRLFHHDSPLGARPHTRGSPARGSPTLTA